MNDDVGIRPQISFRDDWISLPILCFSYLATSNENNNLSLENERLNTSSRSTACIGDVCISEVLVNAFGGETDAVGPSDWTSGEWVEIHNSGTSNVDLSTWTIQDHNSRALPMTTSYVVYPSGATNLNLPAGDYMVLARNGNGGSCGLCLINTNGIVTLKPKWNNSSFCYLDYSIYRRSIINRKSN